VPLDQSSLQKSTAQVGISDPSTTIPSPQGVTSSSYPKQTPVQSSLKPTASGTYTPAHTGSPWDAVINSLTPQQRAQWDAIGTSFDQQQRATQQQHTDMDLRVSGSAYNAALNRQAPNDAAAKGTALYALLTPEQQKLWKEAQKAEEGPGFLQAILPLVAAALAVAGGEALLGAGGAGAGAAAGASAGAGAGAGTGVAASTAAAGEAAAATSSAAAVAAEGTLEEIVVTGTSTLGAGSAAEAAAAIGGLDVAGSVANSVSMPHVAANAGHSLASTMFHSALKGGAINSVIAGIQGKDPLKAFEMGFISGGIGGGIGYGLQSVEASTGALDALGNTGIKAFNAAVSGAATSAVLGGDPLRSGLSGLAGSIGSSVLGDALGTSGQFKVGDTTIDIGKTLGSVAGSMAMSSILGPAASKRPTYNTYGGTRPTPQTTSPGTTTAKPGTPDLSSYTYPTITPTPVTFPTSPGYGLGYGYGGGGVADSGDSGTYWGDDQDKLRKLLAALQAQG